MVLFLYIFLIDLFLNSLKSIFLIWYFSDAITQHNKLQKQNQKGQDHHYALSIWENKTNLFVSRFLSKICKFYFLSIYSTLPILFGLRSVEFESFVIFCQTPPLAIHPRSVAIGYWSRALKPPSTTLCYFVVFHEKTAPSSSILLRVDGWNQYIQLFLIKIPGG